MPDAPTDDVEQVFGAVDSIADKPLQDARSSSPANNMDADPGKRDDKEKDAKKPRKKAARLDEGRLVGDNGFPQLIRDTKQFRPRGKGHEARIASDLNRLLHVYQFWTHKLYPKTPFKETVDRVEKLCHSKRMRNMLGVWRDEAHGKPPTADDADLDDEQENIQSDAVPPSSAPEDDLEQASRMPAENLDTAADAISFDSPANHAPPAPDDEMYWESVEDLPDTVQLEKPARPDQADDENWDLFDD
ncbi:replication fork protection component Swi3-domain-containing protein [Mycena amicta]|nr:replication fork protection component Swi3-domain-containing protein [Mycena amicta]